METLTAIATTALSPEVSPLVCAVALWLRLERRLAVLERRVLGRSK
jgi:HAMP domain-containing protein